MLKLKKIAITGGVASGKTSVCQFFQELGASVVNADRIVHELLKIDTELGQQVIRLLGPQIEENGQISRQKIADLVFKDPKRLQALEQLLHPVVSEKIQKMYEEASQAGKYTFFVVEIPLLFEVQAELFYDVVVAVLTDEKIARHRFEQIGFQKQEYDRRMRRQISPHQKSARADYTLHNNGSLDDLKRQVISLNHILQNNGASLP
ncbi:MAG: dephospho-CoA kinase [Chlamydiia bacterium]|nr:dephospho-CoA kinase [Chlamydiia bacterium]